MVTKNIFAYMTDDSLKDIHTEYTQWLDEGNIPQKSKLCEIRNAYRDMYQEGYIHIMELQYLRECAKRFSQSLKSDSVSSITHG